MNPGDTDRRAPSIKYQPRSKRYYFDVGIGSGCLPGEDTGGKYCPSGGESRIEDECASSYAYT
jgi:hypothetical protein